MGMQFSIVTENAIQGLQTEIPALPFAFQLIEKTYRLDIVLKRGESMLCAKCGQEMLTIVTKRGVADIMAKGDGFNEILVEMEEAADCSGNAGDQLHMQNPVGDVVVCNQAEHLCLVDVAGVCPRMEDAVGIEGIGLTMTPSRLSRSSFGLNTQAGGRRKASLLFLIEVVKNGKKDCMWV
jgi:hypothetical protein